MADIKIYGTLVSATTEKAIVKNDQVVGGFMVLTAAERDNLTTALKKEGMTIFCSTDNNYYRLQEDATTWKKVLDTSEYLSKDRFNQDFVKGIRVDYTQNVYGIDVDLYSPYDESTKTETLPLSLANNTQSGIMSSEDYNALQNLKTRVETLEGKTTRLLYTAGNNPTAEEINNFVVDKGYTSPFSGIAVVVTGTYHIWHYYENDNIGWRDDGVDTVNTFTNTTPGIIQGSAKDGKVYAETDGTGSVYGWDNLLTRVTEAEDVISAKQEAITSSNKLDADLIADGTTNKVFTTDNQLKLKGIEANAQVNKIDAITVNNVTQTIDANKNINLTIDKSTVDLSNVDNTSDLNKPISTAVQSALDNKLDKQTNTGSTSRMFYAISTSNEQILVSESEIISESAVSVVEIDVAESNINSSEGLITIPDKYNKLHNLTDSAAKICNITAVLKLTSQNNQEIALRFVKRVATGCYYSALIDNYYYTLYTDSSNPNTTYITRDLFGVDTSDATANAADLLLEKTAYNADGKITGTIEDYNGEME